MSTSTSVEDIEVPGADYRIFTPDRTWNLMRLTLSPPIRSLFRIRVYGREHIPRGGPAVLASNHIAGIDPILLAAITPRPIRYMAKHELFTYNRALASFLSHGGVFTVRRGEGDLQAVRLARAVLRQGNLLGMFVEGTRQPTEAIGEVKHGTAVIAVAEQAPIIPVVVQGSIYIKDRWWLPHPSTLVVGEPIETTGLAGGQAVKRVTGQLQAELERLQRFAQSAVRAGRPRRALPPARELV
jgi:1-acyl-sn-glycerol-3-phosphate acyltransferase